MFNMILKFLVAAFMHQGKDKAILVQARTGSEASRKLGLQNIKTIGA
jgi:hypothetical protein